MAFWALLWAQLLNSDVVERDERDEGGGEEDAKYHELRKVDERLKRRI